MPTPVLSDSRRWLHPALQCSCCSVTLPLSPSAGTDSIRLVGSFYNTQDLFRSVHRRVLTACGSSVSPMHAKLSCSVRRQALTASGSSVSSLHVRFSCMVHRQMQTPGLACTVRRAVPCCHVVSLSLTLSVVLLRSPPSLSFSISTCDYHHG